MSRENPEQKFQRKKVNNMDKAIRKIEKEVPKKGKAHKDLKHLEKEDKARDKVCAMGKKAMMMKKKKNKEEKSFKL